MHPSRVSVPHGYYSKKYKPSRTRYTENTYQPHAHGPSVCDSNFRPFDRQSSFCREFKWEGSKPREPHSQHTKRSQNGLPERCVWNRECSNGNLLQHGSLGSSKNHFDSHSRRFSGNVRRNKSGSCFNSGHDEYPRYWAILDAEITSNCMHQTEPHHCKRRPNRSGSRSNSGYEEYPRYWASLDKEITSNGRFQTNNPTDSKNNYKRPRKSRDRKPKVLAIRSTTASSASCLPLPYMYQSCDVSYSSFFFSADISNGCEYFEQICPVCENDLSHKSLQYYSKYEDDTGPPKLPQTAVLPCGHAFHSECLMQLTEEEHSREPPCFFCISCLIY